MKKSAQTFGSGCLILIGLFFLVLLLIDAGMASSPSDRSDSILAGLFLGGPPLLLGGWLAWRIRQREQQSRAQRQEALDEQLQQAFFDLLDKSNGAVSVFQFAKATGLSGEEARAYLDQRAKEFGADFNVGDQGEFFYQFPR